MSEHDNTEWFYGSGETPKGPFNRSQIEALVHTGVVRAQTPVWSAEMAGWAPLQHSPLAEFIANSARPVGTNSPSVSEGEVQTFTQAISVCFSKYADFTGRANRPEFWFFYLLSFLAGLIAVLLDGVLFGHAGPFYLITLFGLLLPNLAVGVRRLHDTDRTGWWWLIVFVPLVGTITLIIFLSQRGTDGPNSFG